jgi:hypothetical protein
LQLSSANKIGPAPFNWLIDNWIQIKPAGSDSFDLSLEFDLFFVGAKDLLFNLKIEAGDSVSG